MGVLSANSSGAQDVAIDGPSGTQESVSQAGGSQANPWEITGNLTIGDGQTGALEIGVGGTVTTTGTATLGAGVLGEGTAIVAGAGAEWSAASLFIGRFGTAELTLSDDALLNIGAGTGTITVATESGSTGVLNIGAAAGETAVAAGQISAAELSFGEGDGTLVLNHTDTAYQIDAQVLGENGILQHLSGTTILTTGSDTESLASTIVDGGTLQIAQGATLNTESGAIGDDFDSNGAVIVTGSGSAWTIDEDLEIGDRGAGALTISDGGQVTSLGGVVGQFSAPQSTVTVSGAGSRWQMDTTGSGEDGRLTIGAGAPGLLRIEDGGVVENYMTLLGRGAGIESSATVTGTGSEFLNTFHYVGFGGDAVLTVEDGGLVTADELLAIAWLEDDTGSVAISGEGSLLQVDGQGLRVGERGEGTLTVSDGGALETRLASIGVVAGGTGSVVVTGDGSSWQNEIDIVVGSLGTGDLTITDGGSVTAGASAERFVTVANNAGSAGAVNIGAAPGETAARAGALNTNRVNLQTDVARLNFNHTDTDYVFSGGTRGVGRIDHYSGTTTLTGLLRHTGGTILHGGTMLIGEDGFVDDSVDVLGGTLGGSGIIRNMTIGDGGTFAPGNSIGSILVATAAFDSGSTFEVEISPSGEGDFLDAVDTVTIADDVSLIILPSTSGEDGSGFDPRTSYTIINADNGISGRFDTVTEDFAFLDGELSYGPSQLVLTFLRNDISFESVASTPNQQSIAGAVQALGFGNEIFEEVLTLSDDEARLAFDSLSGEAHSSFSGHLLEESGTLRFAGLRRLNRAFGGLGTTPEVTRLGSTIDGDLSLEVWGEAYGESGDRSDPTNLDVDYSGEGLIFGADVAVEAEWRVGALAAVGRSQAQLDETASEIEADSRSFGIYAGRQLGKVGLRFGMAYSWHEVSGTRDVSVGALSETVESDYDSETAQIYGELSYRLTPAQATIEPFAGLARVIHKTDGFTETGGAAALTVSPSTLATTYTTLGLRAGTELSVANRPLRAYGSLGWQHAFGDTDPSSIASFAGGTSFGVTGMPIAEDSAVVEAGFSYAVSDRARIDIIYSGEFADDANTQGVSATLQLSF